MKRIIKIFCFVFTFTIFNFAFADMGSPTIKSYEAIVTNVNGTKPFDIDGKRGWLEEYGILEYGTKVIVADAYYGWDGDLHIDSYAVSNDDWINIVVDNGETIFLCRVDVNDLTALTKISETEADLTRPIWARVINEDGIKIYDGMSKYTYSAIGEIPYWTELTIYATDIGECPWYYTTYNGVSGWVCELDGDIGYKPYNDEIFTLCETYIENKTGEIIGVIPANTRITNYLDCDPWSCIYYTTYNELSGYIDDSYIAYLYSKKIKVRDEISVYDQADFKILVNEKAKIVDTIEPGTILSILYVDKYWNVVFVEYEGKQGWIPYNEGVGFEEVKQEDKEVIKELEQNDEELDENVIQDDKEANETVNVEYKEFNEEVTQRISGMQMLILCIAGAVIIALTSFVTILLINKKKK